MDKLEKFKTENEANDAIVDDVAARAYVENFALDTFKRADEAQRANRVTKQTADTYDFYLILCRYRHEHRQIERESVLLGKQ